MDHGKTIFAFCENKFPCPAGFARGIAAADFTGQVWEMRRIGMALGEHCHGAVHQGMTGTVMPW
jgi:hypothetical protein